MHRSSLTRLFIASVIGCLAISACVPSAQSPTPNPDQAQPVAQSINPTATQLVAQPSATPTGTAIPTATSTTAPTDTPAPTQAPLPTNTPSPSATPSATPTEAATITPTAEPLLVKPGEYM